MRHQKFSLKGMALACGILWAVAVLFVGGINLISPGYGEAFLQMVSSIYPGYKADPTLKSVIVGTLYALFDGTVGGLVFAWLYNVFAGNKET